jgi:hypothetical protein
MPNIYDYPSNFSNGTNAVTGIGSLFQYSNYVISGWFGIAILLFIFGISFIGALASGSRKALLTSSFITFIFSILLARADLISPVWVFLLIVGIIVGAIGSYGEKGL